MASLAAASLAAPEAEVEASLATPDAEVSLAALLLLLSPKKLLRENADKTANSVALKCDCCVANNAQKDLASLAPESRV